MFDKFFSLKDNHTTARTEITAGITTFFSMAYILAINPAILSSTGMNSSAVLIATALTAAIGTLLIAFLSNYPFAIAPGMGINVYFVYVCSQYGFSWRTALLAVLVSGVLFLIISLTKVRDIIFDSIPDSMKYAFSCGLGLFIAFIGLQGAKLVVADEGTLVTYQHFNSDFSSVGIGAIIAAVGTLITAAIVIKKVHGGIIIGILGTWGMGMICQLLGWYVPNEELGMRSLFPDFSTGIDFSSFSQTFGQVFSADISTSNLVNFAVVVFAMLFIDMFDTIGTLVGITYGTGMTSDKDKKLPRLKGAFTADATATIVGAIFGTPTATTYVESATGIAEGGRTGLSAVVTALLFIVAMFLSPVFLAIPLFATAPALIIVGVYMMKNVIRIDFNDFTEGIPAFVCMISMPMTYSISEGISFGMISYTVLNLIAGNFKKLNPFVIVISLLFILKFIMV